MRELSVFDLIQPAFTHMKKVMFEPFDIQKWIFIIIVSILSGTFLGSNAINNIISEYIKTNSSSLQSLGSGLGNNLYNNLAILIFFFIFLIVLGIVFWRVGACARYMNIDAIMNNRIGFIKLWNMYYKKSGKYFWFTVKISLMIFILMIATIAICASISVANLDSATGCLVMGLILIIVALAFIWLLIYAYIGGACAVPAMLRMNDSISFDDAIKDCMDKIKERKNKTAMFIIGNMVVSMIVSFIIGIISLPFALMVIATMGLGTASTTLSIIIMILLSLAYGLIICAVNAPVSAFVVAYQLLTFSLLFPEYAVLLPIRDENGKIIGTMSYDEHMENMQQFEEESPMQAE